MRRGLLVAAFILCWAFPATAQNFNVPSGGQYRHAACRSYNARFFQMKKLLVALLLLFCTAVSALAQTSITLPIAANSVADLGNGPIKVRMIAGNASIFTAQGSGVGSTSGSSTALTLTATPATPPIVGALISGTGITSGTTIAAYNGTTGITLSAAMTVAGGTTVSWGAACSSSVPANYIQASVSGGYYIMYTQARVCAVSPGGPVNTLLIEPVYGENVGGGVTSFNSRTGAVVPAANDYNFNQLAGNYTLAQGPTIGANTVLGSVAGGTPAALTQAQLTALINRATTALSGALPAWPNNTTTFFRGDGTYSAALVLSAFGRTGAVVATSGDYGVAQVTGAAPLASPTFTGTPVAPTPSSGDNSTTLATTAFVKNQAYASLIAAGTSALGTGAIGSGACASAVTTTATGTATTDAIIVSFNADPTAVTGYAPTTNGMLTIIPYPTSGNVNFKVCNNTGASITPGAITLNWRVVR